MNYRYSIAKSDTFRQAPFAQKRIRWMDQLSILIVTLIAFTIAFGTYVGVLAFRNFTVHIPQNVYNGYNYYIYSRIVLHYEYFIPLYFMSIILGTLQYAISYLFVSRSNNVLNSTIVLICGEMFLGFYLYILTSGFTEYDFYEIHATNQSSPVLPCSYLVMRFQGSIVHGAEFSFYKNYFHMRPEQWAFMIVGFVVFVLVAIVGILAFFLEKDPSSEWAGKSESPKPYQEIIYHLGFGFGGAFLFYSFGSGSLTLVYVIGFVIFATLYYTLYGTLHRNFKLKPYQWGVLIGVTILTPMLGITLPYVIKLMLFPITYN